MQITLCLLYELFGLFIEKYQIYTQLFIKLTNKNKN